MDTSIIKRHLPEESNISSDEECSPSPSKQPKIQSKSPKYAVKDPSSKMSSTTASGIDTEIKKRDSQIVSTSKTQIHGLDILPIPATKIKYIKEDDSQYTKVNVVSPVTSQNEVTDLSQKLESSFSIKSTSEIQSNIDVWYLPGETGEDSQQHRRMEILPIPATKLEYIKEDYCQYTEGTLDITESYQNEIADLSQKMESTFTIGSTSEIQSNVVGRHVPCKADNEKDAPRDAAAKALKVEYMRKYASEYSKELLFAVDVMTLARYLNNLPCKWIIYDTSGKKPISPCDNNMEDALRILWLRSSGVFRHIFLVKMRDIGMHYQGFQQLVLQMAQKTEQSSYNEKSFLEFCMLIAHWAVCAELNGIEDAIEFVPLVICRTIQTMKDSRKIQSNFWEKIAEKAKEMTTGLK